MVGQGQAHNRCFSPATVHETEPEKRKRNAAVLVNPGNFGRFKACFFIHLTALSLFCLGAICPPALLPKRPVINKRSIEGGPVRHGRHTLFKAVHHPNPDSGLFLVGVR